MDKKYIDKFLDNRFFDYPKNIVKSFFQTLRFHYTRTSLEIFSPCLIVCNKISEYDEYLIRMSISTDYVVLKKSVTSKIYSNTLSSEEKKSLFDNMKLLKEAMISVVIFPENQMSIFGKSQYLPLEMTEFMFETGLNIKFINFANSYFVKPLWSPKFRIIHTYFNSKFNITHEFLTTLTKEERNSKINKCMPSSASVYVHKHPIHIKSNNLSHGLESILFACPNCGEMFSLKSEFNHLKCSSCMIPFECTPTGEIYSNGQTLNFDELETFLSETIKNHKFSKNEIISYANINYSIYINDEVVHSLDGFKLKIYANKLKLSGIAFEKVVDYKDVINAELLPSNTLKLTLKSTEVISIKPHGLENLYIIIALINKKTQL